ncbi:hypothetical protein [Brevundimonas sp. TWP2-3-2]|uniref:hypothetical protein n=1 Tax=unclassified Brevundimonas TaxID=2622653 RepID=UPI003CE70F33
MKIEHLTERFSAPGGNRGGDRPTNIGGTIFESGRGQAAPFKLSQHRLDLRPDEPSLAHSLVLFSGAE